MADLAEVAHLFLSRTGRTLRVATKYVTQTRAFFARHGIVDYRIVESASATEGAPAAGVAELITDITSTGATLAANGLKIIKDGLILSSQAQLVASFTADWDTGMLDVASRFVRILEARARAKRSASVAWPAELDREARSAISGIEGANAGPHALLVDEAQLLAAAAKLSDSGVGPVVIARPNAVYEPRSEPMERFAASLAARTSSPFPR
jgi:ATP phosphoribosyltransferase